MEFWVQRTLFDVPREASTKPARRGRVRAVGDAGQSGGRLDHTRVTRDPAVAQSHGETMRLASDLRIGLARSLDRLSPEERSRIRAMLSRSGTSAA